MTHTRAPHKPPQTRRVPIHDLDAEAVLCAYYSLRLLADDVQRNAAYADAMERYRDTLAVEVLRHQIHTHYRRGTA